MSFGVGTPFSQSYENGIMFCGTAYQRPVDLGSGTVASHAVFGNITCAQGGPFTYVCTTSPCTSASCFPVPGESPVPFGTFGASLLNTNSAIYILRPLKKCVSSLISGNQKGVSPFCGV